MRTQINMAYLSPSLNLQATTSSLASQLKLRKKIQTMLNFCNYETIWLWNSKWLLYKIYLVITNNFLAQYSLDSVEHLCMQFVKYYWNYKQNTYIFLGYDIPWNLLIAILEKLLCNLCWKELCWKVCVLIFFWSKPQKYFEPCYNHCAMTNCDSFHQFWLKLLLLKPLL